MKLSAIITGVLAIIPAALAQGFLDSCVKIQLSGKNNSTLQASCFTVVGDQPLVTTELDLNLCIRYNALKQHLAWAPYGKFSSQCDSIHLDSNAYLDHGEMLVANCWPFMNKSEWVKAMIDLNMGIKNKDGYLACGDWGLGTLVPQPTVGSNGGVH
ncbi:hypothetical protein V8F20_008994 [Naviculisporaceae sp. PSN 640]